MATTEIGFTGEVHQAICECHDGQFFIVVFCIHPTKGRSVLPVGTSQHFKTEEEANKNLESEVMKVAKVVLKQSGLSVDQAAKVTVAHGDDAIANERRLIREGNPNLH